MKTLKRCVPSKIYDMLNFVLSECTKRNFTLGEVDLLISALTTVKDLRIQEFYDEKWDVNKTFLPCANELP